MPNLEQYSIEQLRQLSVLVQEYGGLENIPKKEYAKLEREPAEPGGSFADPLGQGLTMGMADEIAGAVGAVVGTLLPESMGGLPGWDVVQHYQGIRDAARENLEDYRGENPMLSLGLEIAGGALTGGVGGARAVGMRGVRDMSRLGQLGAIGAGEGALYGFGAGEGLEDSLEQGLMGAGTGAALGFASRLPEKGLEAIARRTPAHRWQNPLRQVVEEYGGPERVREGLAAGHPESTIADISPEFRGMAAYAGNRQGGREFAEEFLTERQRRMGGQIEEAGRDLSDTDFYGQMDAMQAERSAAADINYERVRALPITADEDMMRALKTPAGKKAAKDAKALLMNKYQLDEFDEGLYDTVEFWDAWKKSMDGLANALFQKGKKYSADVTGEIRDSVVFNVDEQTGQMYRQAREAFAQPSKVMGAMEEGRKMFGTAQDPQELVRQLSGMGADEIDGYLAGVVKELNKRAGDRPETANAAWSIIRSPNFQKKLGAAVGDAEVSGKFIETMRKLGEMNKTYNVVTQGSRTAPMQQAGREMENAVGAAGRMLQGDASAAVDMVKNVVAKNYSNMTPGDMNKIIRFLLSRGDLLDEVMQSGQLPRGLIPAVLGTNEAATEGALGFGGQ